MAKAILTAKANDTFITKTIEEYKELEEDTTLKGVSGQYGISGGWTDGEYLYRAFITAWVQADENQNEVVVVQYDLKTGEQMKKSATLSLNHANDLTYNSKTKQLVVCHGTGAYYKVSLINVDSLQIVETKELASPVYCIDYNSTYDCYVVGVANNHYLYILNSDFEIVKQYGTQYHIDPKYHTQPAGISTISPQGMASDDQCIYYLFSYMSADYEYKHVITVFDWYGNYMTEIEFQLENIEPEAISVVDDTIYVMYNRGTMVYKISF